MLFSAIAYKVISRLEVQRSGHLKPVVGFISYNNKYNSECQNFVVILEQSVNAKLNEI